MIVAETAVDDKKEGDMRTVIWFIYFWLYLVCLYPKQRYFQRKMDRGSMSERDMQVLDSIVRQWAEKLLAMAGLECEVSGLENIPKDRAVLFTPNHQGNFDIPLLISKLDGVHPIVAKIEMDRLPMISKWMRFFGCLFLDRGNPKEALRVLLEGQKLLESGKSLVIFPEGTRSKGDKPGEFKDGAFRMAIKSGVPIMPVVIDGSYKIMEANGFWIKPGKVKLTVLPLIETEGLGREDYKSLPKQVEAAIAHMLQK